jgi:hypothetical protein
VQLEKVSPHPGLSDAGKKPAKVCSIAVHGISFMGEDQSALSRYKKKIKSPRAGIKILIKHVLCQIRANVL